MTDSGERQLDSQTATELYATYSGRLKPFLIGLLRDPALADEALQNTFTRTLTSGGSVEPGRWKAWLFQVAYNEAMSLRRREKIDLRALQQIARTAPRFGLPAWERVISSEQRQRLIAAIEQLPIDQQTVVQQRIRHERTFQQIADELGVPLGTVLTRMRLALARLRKALLDSEPDCP